MKIVLDIEINGEPKEDDVIVFKNGKWKVISKESFLAKMLENQRKVNFENSKRMKELENNLLKLTKLVKEK